MAFADLTPYLIPLLSGAFGGVSGAFGTLKVVRFRLMASEQKGKTHNGEIKELQQRGMSIVFKPDCAAIRAECKKAITDRVAEMTARYDEKVDGLKQDMRDIHSLITSANEAAERDRRQLWNALLTMASPETRDKIIAFQNHSGRGM